MNPAEHTFARAFAIAAGSLTLATHAGAQASTPEGLRTAVRAYRSAHDVEIVHELSDFLAIPNLASDKVNIRRNAEHLLGMMKARSIEARLLESPSGGPPAVYGSLSTPGRREKKEWPSNKRGMPPHEKYFASGCSLDSRTLE